MVWWLLMTWRIIWHQNICSYQERYYVGSTMSPRLQAKYPFGISYEVSFPLDGALKTYVMLRVDCCATSPRCDIFYAINLICRCRIANNYISQHKDGIEFFIIPILNLCEYDAYIMKSDHILSGIWSLLFVHTLYPARPVYTHMAGVPGRLWKCSMPYDCENVEELEDKRFPASSQLLPNPSPLRWGTPEMHWPAQVVIMLVANVLVPNRGQTIDNNPTDLVRLWLEYHMNRIGQHTLCVTTT